MQSETKTKKRKTTGFVLTNENITSEKQQNHKTTLPDMMDVIIRQYACADIMNYMKARYHAHWMKLVSSDWFSMFLQYLNLNDIANLDIAFCNHVDRPVWLNLLKGHIISFTVEVASNKGLKKMTDWLISKHIHLEKLSLKYCRRSNDNGSFNHKTISLLSQNNPNLKKLTIKCESGRCDVHEKLLSCIARFCTKLECLEMRSVDIPDDVIEILSKKCHHFKHIALIDVCCSGIVKLLIVNAGLLSLNLQPSYLMSDSDILGDILVTLGLHCPLLQLCQIEGTTKHITDIQIETFTKGCPNLNELNLSFERYQMPLKIYHKLLKNFGCHNSALEKLQISVEDDGEVNNTVLTNEQCQSLQCLSNGCPLLKKIWLRNFKLSSSDISYLVNHSIHLETLVLYRCNICDDGLIITKEAGKLKYLKRLGLSFNPNVTDESIINLIKGCHNVHFIDIDYCHKLTDTSLYNIAANCPNLRKIYLPFDGIKITIVGLIELLKKCPNFFEIATGLGFKRIPDKIQKELKNRKMLITKS